VVNPPQSPDRSQRSPRKKREINPEIRTEKPRSLQKARNPCRKYPTPRTVPSSNYPTIDPTPPLCHPSNPCSKSFRNVPQPSRFQKSAESLSTHLPSATPSRNRANDCRNSPCVLPNPNSCKSCSSCPKLPSLSSRAKCAKSVPKLEPKGRRHCKKHENSAENTPHAEPARLCVHPVAAVKPSRKSSLDLALTKGAKSFPKFKRQTFQIFHVRFRVLRSPHAPKPCK